MHKTLSAVVVVALAVGGAACGSYTGGTIPDGPSTEVYNITPGASVIIGSGGRAGYGITANTGGSYRIVWNGDQSSSGVHRHFYGSVWTKGGPFRQITKGCFQGACPVESNDVVSNPVVVAGGERVDFDAQTADGIDGFDFMVDFEPVFFDLLIDGERFPSLVFFSAADLGGTISNVGTIPFGLQGT
jgi:hypothetical protein